MPFKDGRWVAPRRVMPKGKNLPLVALYLMVDLLARELKANGGDWNQTLSTVRQLRGENPNLRVDFNEDGRQMTYHTMAVAIKNRVEDWGAK